MTRRSLLAAGAAGLAVLALPRLALAAAPEVQPFTPDAFEAAQRAGKPILVETYAPWCEVCARQAPILDRLRAEPRFKDLVTFKVEFDTQKDAMRRFNARVQSTLIVFHGSREAGRSVGETQPEWVEDLLDKALTGGTS